MKTFAIALTVLSLAACSSAKKEVRPEPAPAAAAANPQSAETAAVDGAKLNRDANRSTDMFGAPEAEGLLVVHFPYDSAVLTEEAQGTLRANAELLRANPQAKLVIEGHTDERGANEYNLALGERRAKTVREYLALLGIDASRMQTVSYGEDQPVDLTSNEDAYAKNRRAGFRELN